MTLPTVRRGEDPQHGVRLHHRVPESEPGAGAQRRDPRQTRLRHLLRAQDGENEGGGGAGAARIIVKVL